MLSSSMEAKSTEILTLESQLSQEKGVVARAQTELTELRTELHTKTVGPTQFPRSIYQITLGVITLQRNRQLTPSANHDHCFCFVYAAHSVRWCKSSNTSFSEKTGKTRECHVLSTYNLTQTRKQDPSG